MPLGPVSMSLWGLPLTQAPRQPDPAPPPQAQGAADAPAWGKAPEPDQPAPQRVQPGQGPQGQQAEEQGRRRDSSALEAELAALGPAPVFQPAEAAPRAADSAPAPAVAQDQPPAAPPLWARLNPLDRWA